MAAYRQQYTADNGDEFEIILSSQMIETTSFASSYKQYVKGVDRATYMINQKVVSELEYRQKLAAAKDGHTMYWTNRELQEKLEAAIRSNFSRDIPAVPSVDVEYDKIMVSVVMLLEDQTFAMLGDATINAAKGKNKTDLYQEVQDEVFAIIFASMESEEEDE